MELFLRVQENKKTDVNT